MIQTTLMKDP
ncbi:hypothetical protein RLOC_00014611 [Lonchura striata]|uniref:Uncharacterized protein n=1 Tax=Lonchura striata TaxID=40157 RepID=A0A218UZA8_9PASE|nr:hypothetical protein RLOC_00014611 [Lonchura striata domestica]